MPHGGRRIAAVACGTLAGHHADFIIVDTPLQPGHANDAARRNGLANWFDAEVPQRLSDKDKGAIIIVTQRLHHDDLCAHLLRNSKEWLCLSLPAIATNDDPWRTVPGRALGRRKYEPLTPGVQSFEQHRALMHEIGAHNYAAQYQQTPYSQMNDQAARGGCFGARDTAAGLPGMWFGMIPETRILDYEIFGIGGSHPAAPPRKMSDDEWDRVAATMTRQPLPLTVSSDAAQPTHQDQSPKPDPAP